MVVVALALDLRPQPRRQLLLVDRADQVIVDAQFEPADDAIVLALVGEQDDRNETRPIDRAKLRAEPERIIIRETGGHENAFEIFFGRPEHAGLRIGACFDMRHAAQELGDAIAGRLAFVDDQHARQAVGRTVAPAQQFLDADVPGRGGAQSQLVGQHLEPHEALDPGHELQVVDRLGQEVVGAGLEPANAVGNLVERGDHDDRDVRGCRIALETPANLEAVHVRHHHVEQHDIDLGVLAGLYRVGAVERGEHLEILSQEPGFEQLHIGGNVVDDENACSHQASPR